MKLRYLALALVMVVGCRKGGNSEPGGGSMGGSAGAPSDAVAPQVDAATQQDAAEPPPPPDAPDPGRRAQQGETCPKGTLCESGLSCVQFVGVTGQPLATCEIPCKVSGANTCPAGQACVAIKDGPGEVCQQRAAGGSGSGGGGSGSSGSGAGSGKLPAQMEPCPDQRCAPGLSCLEYFGIAGPRGPKFTSCEIRCGGGGACPSGQKCVTVADGPGVVCRPDTRQP